MREGWRKEKEKRKGGERDMIMEMRKGKKKD
jgi:hypothetical protein